MSTAIVMPSTTVYEFGDIQFKNQNAGITRTTSNTNESNGNVNSQQQQQQKVLRWGADSSQRAVGSPLNGSFQQQQQQHPSLIRRNSNPASTSSVTVVSLAASVSTLILDNLRDPSPQQSHRRLDRSQSEPAPSAMVSASKAANINTSRYKTELCRPYEESGSCKYGDKCQFAHGMHELRNLVRHPKYKTELCRTFHTIGFCPYGPRCHFIHNAEEARTKMSSSPQNSSAVTILNRPKPLTLDNNYSLANGSTADSPSPNSSLSQSPTNSAGSFFSSEPDIFNSVVPSSPPPTAAVVTTAFSFAQDFTGLVHMSSGPTPPATPPGSVSPAGSLSPRESPPPGSPEARLPVFNRLSANMLGLAGLTELLS